MDQEAIGGRHSNGNGHGRPEHGRRAVAAVARSAGELALRPASRPVGGLLSLVGEMVKAPGRLTRQAARALAGRIPAADLDDRDPDYIRESLPGLWLLASLYFRGEVRGLGNIPEEGPVLL